MMHTGKLESDIGLQIKWACKISLLTNELLTRKASLHSWAQKAFRESKANAASSRQNICLLKPHGHITSHTHPCLPIAFSGRL